MATNKRRFKIYDNMAREYLKGNKTMHQLCVEYEPKVGFFPSIKSLSDHVKKLKEKNRKTPYYKWAIVVDVGD